MGKMETICVVQLIVIGVIVRKIGLIKNRKLKDYWKLRIENSLK